LKMSRTEHQRVRSDRKERNAQSFKLVRVLWEDTARPIGAWQWVEDYELPRTVLCVSVGYLIAETTEALALAPNLGDTMGARVQACGIIRIPRSAVRRVHKLSA